MNATRWFTRILGLLIVGLVLMFAIGEGFNPMKLNGTERAMSVAFFTALAGMVVLWRSNGIGGTLVLGGMLTFYGINFAVSGRFPSGWVFPLCFLPGILALVCWSHDKRIAAVSKRTTS